MNKHHTLCPYTTTGLVSIFFARVCLLSKEIIQTSFFLHFLFPRDCWICCRSRSGHWYRHKQSGDYWSRENLWESPNGKKILQEQKMWELNQSTNAYERLNKKKGAKKIVSIQKESSVHCHLVESVGGNYWRYCLYCMNWFTGWNK